MFITDKKTEALMVVRYNNLNGAQFSNLPTPIPYTPSWIVTDKSISRYFVKKINDVVITEVNSANYSGLISSNIYNYVMLDWKIRGQKHSTVENGVDSFGVAEYNTTQIQNADVSLPGISKKLLNPLQFYQGT
jgi:hypothetical protein